MQRIVMIWSAVALLSGCANGTTDEETIGEAQERLPFAVTDLAHIGPTSFKVTQGGWVEVQIKGFHLQPSGCNKKGAADLILRHLDGAELSRRSIRADNKPKFETWNALKAGVYEVLIDPHGENPLCT
ncbi:MAG: hypothetical protein ABI134_24640, partial [Byssovorax sp.]